MRTSQSIQRSPPLVTHGDGDGIAPLSAGAVSFTLVSAPHELSPALETPVWDIDGDSSLTQIETAQL